MRAPFFAALLLLLAGCVAPTQPGATTEPADAGPLTLLAAAPVAHRMEGVVSLPGPAASVESRTLDHAGGEPTLGVTSDGSIFLVAFQKVLRSDDGGHTWDVVSTTLSSPATLDPFLFVDPTTDRVYSDQLYLGCSWLSWTDDKGDSWTTNPVACGIPVNDHQKLTAAKPRGLPTAGYPNALYYAYNALAGSRLAISLDGGLTWPLTSQTVFPTDGACNGGLHGNIIADADGILYIPKRHCDGFILAKSDDGGLTWNRQVVGKDVGGSPCRKNADLATDRQGNVYGAWPGKDNRLYLSTSQDKGDTWLDASLLASPPGVNTTTMPAVVAGDAGRIALVYYGTDAAGKGPDEVSKNATWHVYVTYSLDALSADPTFVTVQATTDPVQIGPISTNSDCRAPSGSRNLLDFLDAQLDTQGRLVFAHTDGCTDDCADKPEMSKSRSDNAAFGILLNGPSLYADVADLTPPAAPEPEADDDASVEA